MGYLAGLKEYLREFYNKSIFQQVVEMVCKSNRRELLSLRG